MPDWLRALIAGFTAKKLGGGCLSTIFIFVVVYWALGQCNRPAVRHAFQPVKSNTAKHFNTGLQHPKTIDS
jgi:hypothetical protein